jgi:hypothetical protein
MPRFTRLKSSISVMFSEGPSIVGKATAEMAASKAKTMLGKMIILSCCWNDELQNCEWLIGKKPAFYIFCSS